MKFLFKILFVIFSYSAFSQVHPDSILAENQRYRDDLNAKYADPEKSPLKPEDLAAFKGLSFFPIDTAFYV